MKIEDIENCSSIETECKKNMIILLNSVQFLRVNISVIKRFEF